jgi:hypothetical protein
MDRGVELIAICDAETGNYLLMNVGRSGSKFGWSGTTRTA